MGDLMPEFKLVINDPKTGKSYSKSINLDMFDNKKIGDKLQGNPLGLDGYELEITGGSDKSGFPLRKDFQSSARKRVLLTKGVGVNLKRKGMRKRKTIRGSMITSSIAQINLKISKQGQKKIEEVFKVKEEKKEKDETQG